MRILLASEFFYRKPIGGVSRHLHDLSSYMRRQGDDVDILTCSSFAGKDFLPSGTRIIGKLLPDTNISHLNNLAGIYASYDLTEKLNRLGNRYDVIHTHSSRIHFLHRLKLSKPVIATLHGLYSACICNSFLVSQCKSASGARCAICYVTNRWRSRARCFSALIAPGIAIHSSAHYRLMRRSLASDKAWKIICVSDYLRAEIQKAFDLPRDKTITIPNAVSTDVLTNLNPLAIDRYRRRIAKTTEKIILFVGRLVRTKGANVLIEAMPEILNRVDARLLLVGKGVMKQSLERQVRIAGLGGKILFVGSVNDRTLRLLYKAADVCVVPSIYEPFGITAIEACATKTPLVATDTGGLSEIIEHDRTGVKVIPNNARSLAEGVTKVLLNPSYADKIRSKAHEEVLRKYTWRVVGKELRNLYRDISGEYAEN